MALTDNLISYWKLDEASGDAIDAHSTNDLTDTNTVGTDTGKINGGRLFASASSEKFTAASNADFQIADSSVSYTFTGWVKPVTTTGTQQFISKRNGTDTGTGMEYMIRAGTGLITVFWGLTAGSFGSLSSGVTMSAGNWYFFQFGYDASIDKFFVSVNDGTVALSAATTVHTVNRDIPFNFGGTTAEFLNGILDEVGFWKRRLTTEEVTDLYNAGNGLSYDDFDAGGGGGLSIPIAMYHYRNH